jgi:hypothetical protein
MADWIQEATSGTVAGKPISAADHAYATYLNDLIQNQNYMVKPYVW